MTERPLSTLIFRCVLGVFLAVQPLSAAEEEREGGLTGTGIVGEITALGSIIVNEQRIGVDPDLVVTNRVAGKRAAELVPGEIVAVAVSPTDEGWQADDIRQIHPLVGPVSVSTGGRIEVLGINVEWDGAPPPDGTWVAVSGFWMPDGVSATRLDEIGPRTTVSVLGSYRTDPSGRSAMVGPMTLDLEPLPHARDGDVIEVTGRLEGSSLRVTSVDLGLFDHPVSFVLAEGYLTDVAPSGHYTVAGSGLSAYTEYLQSDMGRARVRVCGLDGQLGVPRDSRLADLASRLGCQISSN